MQLKNKAFMLWEEGIKYAHLGIANSNVPHEKTFMTLFAVCNDCLVRGCRPTLFNGGIAAEPIRDYICFSVSLLLLNHCQQ